jgi:hypothetical protein
MKSISKSLIAVLALIAIPSIAADGDSPFMIDKREFKKQYKTIALAPVDAVATLKMPDSVARMIEEEVTRHLQKRGYTVLPSTVLGGIRATMAAQIGGVDDPATGQVDPTKYNAVKTHAFRELWFQHEFDAIATIGIDVLKTHFEKDRAEWDGAKQKIENKGRNRGYAGDIVVTSVSIAVFDRTNKLKYQNYGGLEVLQTRVDAQLVPIPAESFFSDEKRIRQAAQIAMDPI